MRVCFWASCQISLSNLGGVDRLSQEDLEKLREDLSEECGELAERRDLPFTIRAYHRDAI